MLTRLTRTGLAGLALLALIVSGCGAREGQPAAATSDTAPTVESTLYFLTSNRTAPLGVRRAIAQKSPHALQALRALLAGPTKAEQTRGVKSAIPARATLLSFRLEGRTRAVVNLSGLPAKADAIERVRVITQITRTLVGLSGITHVRLRNDSKPWGLWRMSGGVADTAHGYKNLLGFTRVCTAKPGTEAVEGDCFSALP